MSQSSTVILHDNEVSRMMAEKAMNDEVFKKQILDCVRPNTENRKILQAISENILNFRKQIVRQAELKVPHLPNGDAQGLNTYLKRIRNSRKLLGKRVDREWVWVAIPMCITRLAVAFLQSTLRFHADPTPFPFERLPPELRLQVYREALIGASRSGACATVITVTPIRKKKDHPPFRFGCLPKGESKEINVGLLAADRLVNNEAIAILYQLRTFDFTTNVGSIMPFLRSIPEQGRQNLHGIAMELHDKEQPDYYYGRGTEKFWGKGPGNKAAWSQACAYIGQNVKVKALSLTINVKVPEDFKALEWVQDLIKIRTLRYLTLDVHQHWVSGASVIGANFEEGSLKATDHCFSEHLVPLFEYLREEMLE